MNVSVFLCLLLLLETGLYGETWLDRIKSQVESKNWPLIGTTCAGALEEGVTPLEIETLAIEIKSGPLLRAAIATQKIRKLSSTLPFSKGELFRMALFIETELVRESGQHGLFFSDMQTDFACSIERNTISKQTLIHLQMPHELMMTDDGQEPATTAILYHTFKPQLVTCIKHEAPLQYDLSPLKELKDAPGLIQVLSATSHTLITKRYRGGTLSSAIARRYVFSAKQVMEIAICLLEALEGLHSKNIVHRSIVEKNIFLDYDKKGHREKRPIKAFLGGFDHAVYQNEASAIAVQVNSLYIAPEGLYLQSLSPKDYFQTDIFALGCLLHRLLTAKRLPDKEDITLTNLTEPYEKMLAYQHRLYQFQQKCLKKPSKEKKFEELLLKMIDPVASKRGSAKELLQALRKIYAKKAPQIA